MRKLFEFRAFLKNNTDSEWLILLDNILPFSKIFPSSQFYCFKSWYLELDEKIISNFSDNISKIFSRKKNLHFLWQKFFRKKIKKKNFFFWLLEFRKIQRQWPTIWKEFFCGKNFQMMKNIKKKFQKIFYWKKLKFFFSYLFLKEISFPKKNQTKSNHFNLLKF